MNVALVASRVDGSPSATVAWSGAGAGDHVGEVRWLGVDRGELGDPVSVSWSGDTATVTASVAARRARVSLVLAGGRRVVGEVVVARVVEEEP